MRYGGKTVRKFQINDNRNRFNPTFNFIKFYYAICIVLQVDLKQQQQQLCVIKLCDEKSFFHIYKPYRSLKISKTSCPAPFQFVLPTSINLLLHFFYEHLQNSIPKRPLTSLVGRQCLVCDHYFDSLLFLCPYSDDLYNDLDFSGIVRVLY